MKVIDEVMKEFKSYLYYVEELIISKIEENRWKTKRSNG